MGVAAYNRSSNAIRKIIAEDSRKVEFEIMDRLNAIQKYDDAGTPRSSVQILNSNGRWWITGYEKDSYGYWYRSLDELMRRWNVVITGYDAVNNFYSAEPIESTTISEIDQLWLISSRNPENRALSNAAY